MKVSLQTDEVSIKLALAEVASICDGRELVQRVRFGPDPANVLSFTVRPDDVPSLSLLYTSGNLLVRVPHGELDGWLTDDRPALEVAIFRTGQPTMIVRVSKGYSDGVSTSPSARRDDTTVEWYRDELSEDDASSDS